MSWGERFLGLILRCVGPLCRHVGMVVEERGKLESPVFGAFLPLRRDLEEVARPFSPSLKSKYSYSMETSSEYYCKVLQHMSERKWSSVVDALRSRSSVCVSPLP